MPLLTWTRGLPVAGEPKDVVSVGNCVVREIPVQVGPASIRNALHKNDGRRLVKRLQGSLDFSALWLSENDAQSAGCKHRPRGARGKHPPATVCYCTENEGTPNLRAVAADFFSECIQSPRAYV
jgi:hypothetical protein